MATLTWKISAAAVWLAAVSCPGISLATVGGSPAVSVAEEPDALDLRLEAEKAHRTSPWAITPHRPNYLLPVSYSGSPNDGPAREVSPGASRLEPWEVKFQVSFKFEAWDRVLGTEASLHLAYTQVSFWQAYDTAQSSPFRENNYEPEVFLSYPTKVDLLGVRVPLVLLGVAHQSNGRGLDALSRSWNRVYAAATFQRGNLVWVVKPWWRIPDASDDNPHLEKWLGYGDLRAVYRRGAHVFSTTLRNNLRAPGNRGAVELGWSFPLFRRLKGYVQYFNGYGESLIDYDHANQRLGVGVLLSDWL